MNGQTACLLLALLLISPSFSSVAGADDPMVSKSTGLELKRIPAGRFVMGSETSAEQLEKLFSGRGVTAVYFHAQFPTRIVQISKPFYLGSYEVTQQQFLDVMGANPSFFPKSGEQAAQYPVEKVSWYDAVVFCNRLSEADGLPPYYEIEITAAKANGLVDGAKVTTRGGLGYRLPTEAEWEYACRAGSKTVWSSGNTLDSLNQVGWWGGFGTQRGNSQQQTNPIGALKSNKFGLYDMHGNVAEWCQDTGFSSYRSRPPTLVDPRYEERQIEHRVMRGGGSLDGPEKTTSAYRNEGSPGDAGRGSDIGFRVARNAK
jgi:formylglycine-generating enzyme required for sulfatase activity